MTPCWKKTKDSKIKDFTVTTYQNQSHLYQILLSWLVSWSFLSSLSLMVKYKIQSSSLSNTVRLLWLFLPFRGGHLSNGNEECIIQRNFVYAATSWICYSFLSNLTSEDPFVGLNKPLALYERFIKWIMEFDLFKVNIFVLYLLIKLQRKTLCYHCSG